MVNDLPWPASIVNAIGKHGVQLHPGFPSLLPTATPHTTFGTSDLAVTPQDSLLIQTGTVDCPCLPLLHAKTFSIMAAPVAHTIAGIAPGARPAAAQVQAFEASFCAAAHSMPSTEEAASLAMLVL